MNNVINNPVTRNPVARLIIVILNVLLVTKPLYHICYGVASIFDGYVFTSADYLFILEYIISILVSCAFIVLVCMNKLTPKLIGILYIVTAVMSFIGNLSTYIRILDKIDTVAFLRFCAIAFCGLVCSVLISLFFYMSNKRNIGWGIFSIVIAAINVIAAFGNVASIFNNFLNSPATTGYAFGLGIFQTFIVLISTALSITFVVLVIKRKNEALNAEV